MNRRTDNPQRKVSETEVAWLAGFWDGEGSIGIKVQNGLGSRLRLNFAPYAQLVNTHVGSLNRADAILTALGVGHHISWPKRREFPTHGGPTRQYKPLWRLLVSGLRRCKPLLVALYPFLTVKQKDAEDVLGYIYSREGNYYKHAPYTDQEMAIVNHFRLRWRERSGRPTGSVSLESLNDYTQGVPDNGTKV